MENRRRIDEVPVPIIVSLLLILIGLLGVALGLRQKVHILMSKQTADPQRRNIFLGVGIVLLVGGLG